MAPTKRFPVLPALRRSQLRDQRTPARGEESSLLRQRDVALTPASDTKVLPQLIERRAESRGRLEAPEAQHRVVALLHRPMALLGVVVQIPRRPVQRLAAKDPADRPPVRGVLISAGKLAGGAV